MDRLQYQFNDTDSAYGSPTNDFNFFKENSDSWRYEINLDDLNCEMIKPYLIQEEDISCSPWEVFEEGYYEEEDELPMELLPSTSYSEANPLQKYPKESKEKAFLCTMCNSTFSRNHDLKRHARYFIIDKNSSEYQTLQVSELS